jgi:putative oxidoreductase
MNHNRVLWILQWIFGLYFIAVGVMHFIVPEGLPDLMSWMYELSGNVHTAAGIAEILGGMGLILPSLTGIRPELTVWAAVGLMAVMVGALIWHLGREEYSNIWVNVVNLLILGYIAYGRSQLAPLEPKAA